jgi:hypothetical protein
MPDQIPVLDASKPAQVSPGERSPWWAVTEDAGALPGTGVGAVKVPALLLIGIAFIEVSCSTSTEVVNKFVTPDINDPYWKFRISTFIVAGLVSFLLLFVAWFHDKGKGNARNITTNYLVVGLGMSLGWLLGIVLQPFTSGEAGKFVAYAGAISAFLTGYGAGKLDDLVKYIFNPQNLTQRRAFHGALFLVSFAIALIVVYEARFGVYQGLSITTTSPLADAIAEKDYGPTRIEAGGGTPPFKWDITPALPAGLSLDHNVGVISGKPKGVSPKLNYTITVTDGATPPIKKSKELSLEVLQAQNQEPHSNSEQLDATNRQLQAQNQELQREVERLQHEAKFVELGSDLLFLSGGYQLSSAGKTELDYIVPKLKGLQNAKVVVYG